MKEAELTQEQALEWLRKNRELLNLKAISGRLDCSPSLLSRSVAGTADARGYDTPFPKRCLAEMAKIIDQFKEQ